MSPHKTLWFERWHPLTGGAIAALIYWRYGIKYLPPEELSKLFSNAITLGAIAIGFLATVQSILVTVQDRELIKAFREAGKYNYLIGYLLNAIHASFFLAAISTAGLIYPPAQTGAATAVPTAFVICCDIWVLSLITAILTYYRVIHIFSMILLSK
jgi:hypothetical protein